MKYLTFTIKSVIIFGLLISCNSGQNYQQKLVLTNNAAVDLKDKAVSIDRDSLKAKTENLLYPLLTSENGDTVASQLDDLNNDGQWDQLFFVVDIPAHAAKTLTLKWIKTKPQYTIRTSVRFGKRSSENTPVEPKTSDTLLANQVHKALGYQPYQTDGPTWENDKVGFRHYFDGRNANDLYGKKAPFMSPENVGINAQGAVEDNYHVMADWGRDILSVGNSVGIGGFGLLIGDSLVRLGITNNDTLNNIEETVFTIVAEGPVHSVMHFDYNDWHVDKRLYHVDEITSIWPGMYAYKNKVKVSGLEGDEKLFVGLVNSNTDHPLGEMNVDDKYVILYTHDKQTYDNVWYLGLALILPKDAYLGYGEAPKEGQVLDTYYGKLQLEDNIPVDYYAVGCWEIADSGFTDSTYFKNYVVNLAEQLAADVSVKFE